VRVGVQHCYGVYRIGVCRIPTAAGLLPDRMRVVLEADLAIPSTAASAQHRAIRIPSLVKQCTNRIYSEEFPIGPGIRAMKTSCSPHPRGESRMRPSASASGEQ
jgi:hypothetical protein